jgi:hypothetical protein
MTALSTKPSVDRYMQKTGIEGSQGDEGQLITRAVINLHDSCQIPLRQIELSNPIEDTR